MMAILISLSTGVNEVSSNLPEVIFAKDIPTLK